MITAKNYKYESWSEMFPHEVKLEYIPIYNNKWRNYFGQLYEHKSVTHDSMTNIEKMLEGEIGDTQNIFPYPMLMYNAFNSLDLDRIKVVFVGQDPYINSEVHNEVKIPQAMGLSFSVPVGMRIPPSLDSVFKNQQSNGVIREKQPHGNLEYWVSQGCFMMNTALTVRESESGSHCNPWKPITDKIIKHISNELDGLIFMLWGIPAYEKLRLIDLDKHNVIISSHPSGLSCNKPMRDYPPFVKVNHFGQINDLLVKAGNEPIDWNLF